MNLISLDLERGRVENNRLRLLRKRGNVMTDDQIWSGIGDCHSCMWSCAKDASIKFFKIFEKPARVAEKTSIAMKLIVFCSSSITTMMLLVVTVMSRFVQRMNTTNHGIIFAVVTTTTRTVWMQTTENAWPVTPS